MKSKWGEFNQILSDDEFFYSIKIWILFFLDYDQLLENSSRSFQDNNGFRTNYFKFQNKDNLDNKRHFNHENPEELYLRDNSWLTLAWVLEEVGFSSFILPELMLMIKYWKSSVKHKILDLILTEIKSETFDLKLILNQSLDEMLQWLLESEDQDIVYIVKRRLRFNWFYIGFWDISD